jgi:hypothetical protein
MFVRVNNRNDRKWGNSCDYCNRSMLSIATMFVQANDCKDHQQGNSHDRSRSMISIAIMFARANNLNNRWQWGSPERKHEINNNQLACYCCRVFCSARTSAPATQRFCLSLEGTRRLTWIIFRQSPGHGEKVKMINQIGFLFCTVDCDTQQLFGQGNSWATIC